MSQPIFPKPIFLQRWCGLELLFSLFCNCKVKSIVYLLNTLSLIIPYYTRVVKILFRCFSDFPPSHSPATKGFIRYTIASRTGFVLKWPTFKSKFKKIWVKQFWKRANLKRYKSVKLREGLKIGTKQTMMLMRGQKPFQPPKGGLFVFP